MKPVRKTPVPILLFMSVFLLVLLAPPRSGSSSPVPPVPSSKRWIRPDTGERQRAQDLYRLTRREHPRLHWDACLARKAFLRAKQLVIEGRFEHEDPRTGENPAWEMVGRCYGHLVAAGENLAKGVDTPENIHKALMASATHRKNIIDPRFERIGVGCYDSVCVELFAGF
jgi:uncharacterized protein YkwD